MTSLSIAHLNKQLLALPCVATESLKVGTVTTQGNASTCFVKRMGACTAITAHPSKTQHGVGSMLVFALNRQCRLSLPKSDVSMGIP